MPVLKFLCARFKVNDSTKTFVSLMACAFILSAQIPASREYQIKAAFLYNFTQFVEWPAESFEHAKAPLVIGILGEDPFGAFLTETVKGEKINGHSLAVVHFNNAHDIRRCHILFISMQQAEQVKETLTMIKDRHVLTVSDAPNFIVQGGLVRFVKENNKIRLQINQEAAKENDISISSKLLRLAEIVKSPNP